MTASSSQGYDENVCNMVAEEQGCNENVDAEAKWLMATVHHLACTYVSKANKNNH